MWFTPRRKCIGLYPKASCSCSTRPLTVLQMWAAVAHFWGSAANVERCSVHGSQAWVKGRGRRVSRVYWGRSRKGVDPAAFKHARSSLFFCHPALWLHQQNGWWVSWRDQVILRIRSLCSLINPTLPHIMVCCAALDSMVACYNVMGDRIGQ